MTLTAGQSYIKGNKTKKDRNGGFSDGLGVHSLAMNLSQFLGHTGQAGARRYSDSCSYNPAVDFRRLTGRAGPIRAIRLSNMAQFKIGH